jgi:radical SAM protein with 4Fe4S-binding SPASM domain
MSLEKYLICLDFLHKSHENHMKLLGGEPTLHPEIRPFVELNLERGIETTLFTNGLWEPNVQEFFEQPNTSTVQFVFNVNELSLLKSRDKAILERSLKIAGSRAIIGFNIYRTDFDLMFLGDLIEAFSLKKTIRLGLASPIVGVENDYILEGELKTVGKRLVAQLLTLEKKDILGSFDCGFPLCLFNRKELGTLALATQGFSSVCDAIIDVGVDLTVWPCFPLSNILNVKMTDFKNLLEIKSFYQKKFNSLRQFGHRESCLSCKYLRRGQCSGGCLARNILLWQKDDPEILEKLNS